jgi:uncharacterized membrane protein
MPTRIPFVRMLGLLLVISSVIAPALGQSSASDNSNSERFILDIYPDRAGDTLVIGYADNLKSIQFLNKSEYTYDNSTRQLVARTNALTRKNENLWTLRFELSDRLNGYYAAFYLPSDVKLRGVNISDGLKYLISMRNESLVVEVQGYDVQNPAVTIEYLQPFLKEDEKTNSNLYLFMATMLLALGFAFVVMKRRERVRRTDQQEPSRVDDLAKSIEIISELDAVMHTLTVNELTVLKALLNHGGSMTQLDLRYKTNIPKSSLSDILVSLEKRKIITKKEMGKTNLIQISEKFLPK